MSALPEPNGGWQLVQLASLLHQIEEHSDAALRGLSKFDDEIGPTTHVSIEHAAIENVRAATGELMQLVERAEQLADQLANGDEDFDVDYAEVAAAAARELAHGMLDADRALLAARVLHVKDGWPALVEALQSTDAHSAWRDTTITDLLGAFRGVSPQLVRRIATAAGLAPEQALSTCEPDEIARLAIQLDVHASRP